MNGLTGEDLKQNTANDVYNKLAEIEAMYREGKIGQNPDDLKTAIDAAFKSMKIVLDGDVVGAFVNKALGNEMSGGSYTDISTTPTSTTISTEAALKRLLALP